MGKATVASGVPVMIQIKDIIVDSQVSARSVFKEKVRDNYVESLKRGDVFPPADVYHDGKSYWLADGSYRLEAAKRCGRKELLCNVHVGGKREATLAAAAANVTNGLPRSHADIKKAVLKLLRDKEWSKWSDNTIAGHLKINRNTVHRWRCRIGDRKRYRLFTDKFGNTQVKPLAATVEPAATKPNLRKARRLPETDARLALSVLLEIQRGRRPGAKKIEEAVAAIKRCLKPSR